MEIPQRHLRRRKKVPRSEFYDEEEQERLIEKFTEQANAQARVYRIMFSLVLAVPSPAFIFAKHCRVHPKLAFLSLVSLITSILGIRVKSSKLSLLQKLNIALALLVALQAWFNFKTEGPQRADTIWVFPIVAAVSAFLLDRWLKQVKLEIRRLADKRYELRGV